MLDLVGSDAQEAEVDEACVMFFNDLVSLRNVTLDLMKKYRKVYGTATPAQVEKIHRSTKELKTHVPEAQQRVHEALLAAKDKEEEPGSDLDYFGSKIKFTYDPALPSQEEMSYLQDIKKERFSLQANLTFNYDVIKAQVYLFVSSHILHKPPKKRVLRTTLYMSRVLLFSYTIPYS